ncbi:hypothetical protein QFC20_004989 [Naganishia adeliensis]|uniref:Uncharacterized protein n=1 Tax=Naganishia adeliensis TaxID=92952 RepID=A0ACC2VUI4_9TREE|nr:hypothetical protein QFC20_004989 [Naganishia adeliensis]
MPPRSPSFVPGTPSSPISTPSKRNRQRSSSPLRSTNVRLAPAPTPHGGREKHAFRVKQYLAVESAAPIHGEEVERGFLGESAEREAEYLVDEGSQLVRDQLRIAGDGTGEGVQWRTVSVRERTIQEMWIHGRSWTYRTPPPKISLVDPLLAVPVGDIIGKSNSELREWDKFDVEEASPFDSQRGRKRKIQDQQNPSPNPLSTTPPTTPARPPLLARPESPYVFVNDLPPWEWFLPTESQATGGSQSQGARESLRQSGDDRTARRQDGQKLLSTTPKTGTVLPPAQISPEVGFTSFLTDASLDIPEPTNTGPVEKGGRVVRRMPVLLKDLDHAKFHHQPDKKSRIKAPTALEKEVKRREERAGARDKRVRELQGGQGKRVRPIKDYLPLPMRVEPKKVETGMGQGLPVLGGAARPDGNGGGDESAVEEISFADSVRAGGEDVQERAVPRILVDGTAVVSPEKASIAQKGRMAERSVLPDQRTGLVSDQERWRVACHVIPQPHTLPALPGGPQPEPPKSLYERIPTLPPTPHPFHPDLRHYIATEPDTHVTWLIPILGSVIVTLPDELPAKFRPSPGYFALTSDEYRETQKRRQRASSFGASTAAGTTSRSQVRPLVWTKELLREFWEKFTKMRRVGRFGPISLALVSEETSRSNRPDDELLETHQCLPFNSVSNRTSTKPVRPEMGDHIKVGCNLRYTMAVRCLLKDIQLGGEPTSRSRSPADNVGDTAPRETRASSKSDMARRAGDTLSVTSNAVKARKEEPFRGVMLCLVGTRGEVLLVV